MTWIDDLRCPVRPIGLKPGSGIWKFSRGQPELIDRAGSGVFCEAGEITEIIPRHLDFPFGAFEFHSWFRKMECYRLVRGCPDAKGYSASRLQFGTDRVAPANSGYFVSRISQKWSCLGFHTPPSLHLYEQLRGATGWTPKRGEFKVSGASW